MHASDLLSRDLRRHYNADNPDMFRTNQDVQIGVYLANCMYARLLRGAGVASDLSLGLSLGEYNHIVEIGALSWDETLRLVAMRGALYAAGPEGAMVAFSPVSEEEVETLLSRIDGIGFAEISNYNAPTQFVIAGERHAIERLLAIAEDELFIHGVLIEKKIPMHCRLFASIAHKFAPYLASARWFQVPGPYIPNVTGEILYTPSHGTFIEHLTRHVFQPVKWRHSVAGIVARHPDAILIEVGPKSVLYDLLHPRWVGNRKFKTDGEEPLRQVEEIAAMIETSMA